MFPDLDSAIAHVQDRITKLSSRINAVTTSLQTKIDVLTAQVAASGLQAPDFSTELQELNALGQSVDNMLPAAPVPDPTPVPSGTGTTTTDPVILPVDPVVVIPAPSGN